MEKRQWDPTRDAGTSPYHTCRECNAFMPLQPPDPQGGMRWISGRYVFTGGTPYPEKCPACAKTERNRYEAAHRRWMWQRAHAAPAKALHAELARLAEFESTYSPQYVTRVRRLIGTELRIRAGEPRPTRAA